MTVGTVMAIRNAARPGAGSVSSACWPSTSPVDAFDVSMSGAAAVTEISSEIDPTSITTSSVMNCCVPIVRPFARRS